MSDARYYVEVVRRAGDQPTVKRMGPHTRETAERILRGVEINLDHDRFYAEVTEGEEVEGTR